MEQQIINLQNDFNQIKKENERMKLVIINLMTILKQKNIISDDFSYDKERNKKIIILPQKQKQQMESKLFGSPKEEETQEEDNLDSLINSYQDNKQEETYIDEDDSECELNLTPIQSVSPIKQLRDVIQEENVVEEDTLVLPETQEEKEENVVEEEEKKYYTNDELKKMKVGELKTLCKSNNIKGYSKLKKNQLIEKILECKIEH